MSMKVLIVDPDWYFLRQARDFLEPRGHITLHEPDPEQGCLRAERWKPDVAILSAELASCCDGDLLARFHGLRPRPAILLTANLDQFGKAWRAWQRGGDEMLFKPLMHRSELHVAIFAALENTVCPRRRAAPRGAAAISA